MSEPPARPPRPGNKSERFSRDPGSRPARGAPPGGRDARSGGSGRPSRSGGPGRTGGPGRPPRSEGRPRDPRESGPIHVARPRDDRVAPWVGLRSAKRNPLIYRRFIEEVDPSANPGNIVTVYDKTGAFFGRGLYNPNSEIVVRLLSRQDVPIDDAFFARRLQQAANLRSRLRLEDDTDAYRVVHAEGDGLSGIVIERFADTLVAEVFSLGMAQRAEGLLKQLAAVMGPPTRLDRPQSTSDRWKLLVRHDATSTQREGMDAAPADDEATAAETTILEHGVRYRVDFRTGHKTGFFCDQRDNRRMLARYCRDARVLDLCCYSGGFGLAAKCLGGAAEVTGVDLDEAAIATAKQNANLNQVRINHVHSDAFAYLRQMIANQQQYDVVILDPPKLALTRRDLEEAVDKYYDLNTLALQVVRPAGLFLTCSCSGLVDPGTFRATVERAGWRVGRPLQRFAETAAAPDHPVMADCPESAYLKALWYRVL